MAVERWSIAIYIAVVVYIVQYQLPIPKVVIATNIAETSVTIPGVTHVVDCCR